MAKLRPIKAEDQLTLVDHLDELRSRLIGCVIVLVVVFGVCLWQSQALLTFINAPMADSQRAAEIASEDPFAINASQDQRLATALLSTATAMEKLGDSVGKLGANSGKLTASEKRELRETRSSLAAAATLLEETADATPVYGGRRPVTLGVAEPFMTTLTVAGYAALLITMPFLLFQLYAFILPAFTPRERQVAFPLMMLVPALFLIGATFAYFVVLPGAVGFLQSFNAGSFDVLLQAKTYYKFAVLMMAGIGLLFQIPVAVLVITRLGIMSPAQLRKNRGYVILGVTVLAAVGNGSPDPFTMLMVMIPLIALFEISVAVAAWIERRTAAEVEGGDTDHDDPGNDDTATDTEGPDPDHPSAP